MADISIQFHALPTELLALSTEIAETFALHVIAMSFFPFEIAEIDATSLGEVFERTSSVSRLAFTLDRPDMSAANELEFAARNPDHLRLEIGKETDKGLEQSWLTARTEHRDALRVWRKVANMLKKATDAGVLAVNSHSGVAAALKSFRYTRGAKVLQSKGVPALPPQGPNGPRLVLGSGDTESPGIEV